MTGIHQRTAPTKINRTDWNDLVTFLGGTSSDPQVDATKILLAQGGSLLSTWRYATDLTKIDAAKVAGNIAAAQMQTNVLAAIIAANGIVDADVAAAAAIAKSKISTSGTWALADIPVFPKAKANRLTNQSIPSATWTSVSFTAEEFDTDNIFDLASPTQLVCKTAGYYLVGGGVYFSNNATGDRGARITKGGIGILQAGTAPNATAYCSITLASPFNLAVNDVLTLDAYQDSGADLNLVALSTAPLQFFMFRLP